MPYREDIQDLETITEKPRCQAAILHNLDFVVDNKVFVKDF